MEKVLCIARKDIPGEWLSDRGQTPLTSEAFYRRLNSVKLHWLARETAEKNPAFKQVIPYVIFQTADAELVGCYQRNGSEKRLADLWSVGIGGHINPKDASRDNPSLESLVDQGLFREIEEEIGKPDQEAMPEFAGIINEEQTSVGSVHLGLVYRMTIKNPDKLTPSGELSRFHWIKIRDVMILNLELWSRLALNLMENFRT
jgi:predicted NUDIX family phosphoesterase